jgi:hypothetical protein
MRFTSSVLSVVLSLQFFGCQTTGYFITDSNLPVAETRKAATAVIGPPRLVSLNGRELVSVYHDNKFQSLAEDAKAKFRFYTKVTILGARRPYEINIQVFKEELDPDSRQFVTVGLDDGLSQKRAIEIKKAHNYSLEKNQSIDGDAPF